MGRLKGGATINCPTLGFICFKEELADRGRPRRSAKERERERESFRRERDKELQLRAIVRVHILFASTVVGSSRKYGYLMTEKTWKMRQKFCRSFTNEL